MPLPSAKSVASFLYSKTVGLFTSSDNTQAQSIPPSDAKSDLLVDSLFVNDDGQVIGAKCDRGVVVGCTDEVFIQIMKTYGYSQFPKDLCLEPYVPVGDVLCGNSDGVGACPEEKRKVGCGGSNLYDFLKQCNTTSLTIPLDTVNSMTGQLRQQCDAIQSQKNTAAWTLTGEIVGSIVASCLLITAIIQCRRSNVPARAVRCVSHCMGMIVGAFRSCCSQRPQTVSASTNGAALLASSSRTDSNVDLKAAMGTGKGPQVGSVQLSVGYGAVNS